jgi:hypothetical protein
MNLLLTLMFTASTLNIDTQDIAYFKYNYDEQVLTILFDNIFDNGFDGATQ